MFSVDTLRRAAVQSDSQTKIDYTHLDVVLLTFIYMVLMEHVTDCHYTVRTNQAGIVTECFTISITSQGTHNL